MAFNVLGINHKTAPVALREKVAFSEERLVAALQTLRQEVGVAEVVILSTCNRTEVYWAGPASGEELSQWLERHHGHNLDLARSLYVHQEQRAVEHAFSVASGLDSMVLGEAQILGQLKDAYRVAQEAGSTGPALNKLFQAAFSAAKRVRSETRIGENAVSIASATVSLARRVYSDLSAHTALMVGAGEMNALAARHFASAGVKRMVIANRTLARAQALAAELKAHAVGLDATWTRNWRRRTSSSAAPPAWCLSSPRAPPKLRFAHGAGGRSSWWTWPCRAISIRRWPISRMCTCSPSTICNS